MRAGDLFQLGSKLRESVGTKPHSRCDLRIKYGESIDQDYETTNLMDWDESGVFASPRDYEWDASWNDVLWTDLPASLAAETRSIYRAYCLLGWLSEESCSALTRSSDEAPESGIWPDSISIEIDPICPTMLSDEELVCTGLISINFSGNGYFSWGPTWEQYSTQYRSATPVTAARKITREMFPVPRSEKLDRISEHLGDRFFNRAYYEPGDWILSVTETG